MRIPLVPAPRRTRFAFQESAATLLAALCWTVLAFAMYAEGYDLSPDAPVQMSGREDIENLALLFALSIPATWLLRSTPWARLSATADVVIALRLAAVVLLSALMFFALMTGLRIPLLGWSI